MPDQPKGVKFPDSPKYKIAVSGSAVNNCAPGAYQKAKIVGEEIAKNDAVLVTGATTDIPHWATIGAKEHGGISIGLSPASSKAEHVKKYRLPVSYMDLIIYTGFDYSGRNLLMIRSADAAIFICGRIGTLNEFTIAFEDKKPIGILTGSGGITTEIEGILDTAKRGHNNIVFDDDPAKLVKNVIGIIHEQEKHTPEQDRRFD
ncbi:MAG: hypothetical protein WC773_02530 [Patescibacteria group bacterium]|jgi:hypothetical protein